LLTTMLQGRVVKREGQLRASGRFSDLLFECRAAAHGDLVAVAFHGHAQSSLQAFLSGSARHAEAAAVIAHGGRPGAINDRPLLGDAVRLGAGLRGVLAAPPAHGVALETLGRVVGAQRLQRLLIAADGLGSQPVGPRPAQVAVVDLLAPPPVALLRHWRCTATSLRQVGRNETAAAALATTDGEVRWIRCKRIKAIELGEW
jgi:hypothetical protein